MCTDWDIVNTRDFEYLNEMWKKEEENFKTKSLDAEIKRLGDILISDIELPIGSEPLTKSQSKFFKQVYQNPVRGVESFIIKK